MQKRLWNTLKYGNRKTKKKLYLMLGILLAGVVLAVVALLFQNLLLGFAAFLLIFIDGLILFDTSFEQKTVSVKSDRTSRQEEKAGRSRRKPKTSAKNEEEDEDEPGALEWVSSEKKKRRKKSAGGGPEELDGIEEIEDINEAEELVPEKKSEKEKAGKQNPLAQYDEKKLKKIMVAYKVKKHHVPIMIDMCSAEKIVQSPAYLWNDASYLYFLVLEEEPRLIKTKRSASDAIHIRKGITARPMEEYPEMNEPSVINMIFGSLMPKYYKVETGPYRTEFRKNLYSAAPGIWCTSASVKNLLKILPDRFVLDGGKTEEESIYYQEIYNARLMFWDGITSAQEYKEKVLDILGGLIQAGISESTVKEYLNAMLMKGLIPREYAEYVISKRKK